MKKILAMLIAMGFISTSCFAAEASKAPVQEPVKAAEAKVANTAVKAEPAKEEAVKKETKKTGKKVKKKQPVKKAKKKK